MQAKPISPTDSAFLENAAIPSASALFSYRHYGPSGFEGSLSIHTSGHTKALQTGLDLLPQKPFVLLGISPGNAFFTRKRIEITVCAMAQLFGELMIVIPDAIATHTYRALGYAEEQVPKKARKEGLNIRNRCLNAIEQISKYHHHNANIRLCNWEEDIESLPGYWNAYDDVCHLFNTHQRFQQDVLNKGRELLQSKLGAQAVTDTATRECIEYILKEFAYLTICRNTIGRDLIIPYHQDFTLGQHFCDGEYQAPLPGIGWVTYSIELAHEIEAAQQPTESLVCTPA